MIDGGCDQWDTVTLHCHRELFLFVKDIFIAHLINLKGAVFKGFVSVLGILLMIAVLDGQARHRSTI